VKKDLCLKRFLLDKRRFADVINGFIGGGELLILPEDLSLTGRGVPKITEKYGKNAFEFRENSIVVKIPFNWINVMGNKLGNKVGNKSATEQKTDIHLNETQLQTLNYIRDNNNITKKQLQEKTKKSKTTIDNTISFLKEKKLIERIGSNKKGYWQVNDVENGRIWR